MKHCVESVANCEPHWRVKTDMNRTWNYHRRVGGAESLGSAGTPSIRVNEKVCDTGRHKWMTRKWSRKCLRCGIEQAKDGHGKFS